MVKWETHDFQKVRKQFVSVRVRLAVENGWPAVQYNVLPTRAADIGFLFSKIAPRFESLMAWSLIMANTLSLLLLSFQWPRDIFRFLWTHNTDNRKSIMFKKVVGGSSPFLGQKAFLSLILWGFLTFLASYVRDLSSLFCDVQLPLFWVTLVTNGMGWKKSVKGKKREKNVVLKDTFDTFFYSTRRLYSIQPLRHLFLMVL